MKAALSLLFLLFAGLSIAQENVYTMRIKDTQGKVLPNIVVTGTHTNGKTVLTSTTNASGEAVFKLKEPGFYSFSYLQVKNADNVEIKEGFYGTFTHTVTYDPQGVFAEKPKANRSGIVFTDIPARQLTGKPQVGEVKILVKRQDRTLVTNIAVKLISVPDKTRYSTTTNAAGEAIFYVPVGKEYEIDIDQTEAFKTLSVPNQAGLSMTEVVFYEKTKIQETVKGDTIIQPRITEKTGSSTHVLFTLTLVDLQGKPLANEPIFMSAQTGKRVYQGVTDDKGMCSLLLQKGSDYVLNFKYEQNVHLVEAPVSQGFHTASATRRYRGSKEIEAMLAAQQEEMRRMEEERKLAEAEMLRRIEEDKKLAAEYKKKALIPVRPTTVVPDYRSTPVKTIPAPPNYLKSTAEGYDLDFGNASGPTGTATVVGNKLFAQQGTYSSNYYCVQAGTGSFVWGLELGESGLSPAVYHDGVLLINTYSCTLYAVDAVSGKLLWSKWLAGTVYSTPTASGNAVYVVYNHGGKPVLVSFDLRSGNFKWMQMLDDEAIACPVVEGSEVHVASQSGTYYVFNKETGVRTATTKDVYVLSSPTISGDKVFVTAKVNGEEKLVSLDRKTLDVKQVFDSPVSALGAGGAVEQMNFNGSHPVVYQNKYIVLTDKDHLYVFSAETEKKLWEQPVALTGEQIPVIANNKVYLATEGGKVMSYNIITGQPNVVYKGVAGSDAEGQPVFGNGFLFVATAGVLKAIKTTTAVDWNQWNKDASHNTVWN